MPQQMLRFVFLTFLLSTSASGLAQEVTLNLSTQGQGIDRNNLAVIINTADPLSMATGSYYAMKRHIPAENVIRVSFPVGASVMPPEEFTRVKSEVDASAPHGTQAYLLAWTAPYRVGCMSITSAFAFGYDEAYCAKGCTATRLNPYFNSLSRLPSSELNVRPAMMLAGRSFPEVKALVDRGIESDGTFPQGTAYLMVTGDKARNSRVLLYPLVQSSASGLVNIEILKQDNLTDRSDVLFYFTGMASVQGLETIRFLPGAIADHLTSFGGQLTDSAQMSALKWLEAGATGSYGAVVEPCNFPQKFPHPAVVIGRYIRGENLIEAYWKSVAWPGQGVFIGEPLAAPFRRRQ